jgi:hypothetical protein
MHVAGEIDPHRDMSIVETELLLADLNTVGRCRQRMEKREKTGDRSVRKELDFLARLEGLINDGQWLYGKEFSFEEQVLLQEYQLLSAKPVFLVANVSEGMGEDDPRVRSIIEAGETRGIRTVVLAGQMEAELGALSEQERQEFYQELGLQESGLQRIMAVAHEMLDLITFFTAGEEEARAWIIKRHTKAQDAAGKIHSDMKRGFIRAEVFAYDDLIASGNLAVVREKGLFRLEGREYIVQEGDIMYFRFNV